MPQKKISLTPAELRVVELLVDEAMSNDEIAAELAISVETVKRHFGNIFDKTGYSSRLELAVRTLQKRSFQEDAPEMTNLEFLLAVQNHIEYVPRKHYPWLLDAVRLYSKRLRDGKVQPASVNSDGTVR